MASPQRDTRFIGIATELFDAIMMAGFSSRERLVVDALMRVTYQWLKKEAEFSSSTVTYWTKMDRANAKKTMAALVARKVLICTKPATLASRGTYRLNKNYTTWEGCNIVLNPVREGDSESNSEGGQNNPPNHKKTGVKTTPVGGVKTTPLESKKEKSGGSKQPPEGGQNNPPDGGQNDPTNNKARIIKKACCEKFISRLEKLQGNILPRGALEKIEQWQSQNLHPALLEAWLEAGLVHVENRATKFSQPWRIVFEEAEKARERDRHDRYGLPYDFWSGYKVYRNGSGIPCLDSGLPLTGHPDHPSQQKKARTPNEH
jgi:hypothetical protein